MSADVTYEALRFELETLVVPTGEVRNLRWLARTLAVARNGAGDYEIFLRGPELATRSPLVRRHLQHGDWRPMGGGTPFAASRIVLPSAPHFASVSALIAVELLRAGIYDADDPQAAFSDVEPIIEMAIRRGALPENVVVGLIGELILLRQCLLTNSGKPELRSLIIDSWHGWQVGGRDFTFGSSSIEVKTTQSASSVHEFSGIHQLEEVEFPSGEHEELHLLSVGLAASTVAGESLPAIVDQVLGMLNDPATGGTSPLQVAFLSRIERYGAEGGSGYKHATMSEWSVYSNRYTATFPPRLYRIADPAMRLLRREIVEETFVSPASLSFTMALPEAVSAFNPAASWQQEIAGIVRRLIEP